MHLLRAPIVAGGESIRRHRPLRLSRLHVANDNLLICSMSAPNVLNAVSRWAIPVFVGVSLAQSALYDVRGGSRAVIFDRLSGVQEKVVNEGTHFLIPWLQKAIIYDVRTKPRNISTTTGSKDLQMVSLTLRVLHRPEVQQLPKIYQVS
jgi:prohibitin 1